MLASHQGALWTSNSVIICKWNIRNMSSPISLFLICILLSTLPVSTASEVGYKRRAADGSSIVFVSLVEPPFLWNTTLSSDYIHTGHYTGFLPDLIHELAGRLGHPYRIQLPKYPGYGVPDPQREGGWTGLIGDVVTGRADVAAAPLSMTSSRRAVVDFTTPFMTSGIAVLYYSGETDYGPTWPEVIDSPLYFCDKDVEVITIYGSLTHYFLESKRRETSPVGMALGHLMSRNPKVLVWTKEEGVQRVIAARGKSLFFLEKVFADFLVANDAGCLICCTTGTLNPKPYAFAVRKYSPLLQSLNFAIGALENDGTIESLYTKWWSGQCTPKSTPKTVKITSENSVQKHLEVMQGDENRVSSFMESGVNQTVQCMGLPCIYLIVVHLIVACVL